MNNKILNFIFLVSILSFASAVNPGCVELYEHCNYQGRVHTICHNTPAFCNFNFNNILSAVKLGPGTFVDLYQGNNYQGRTLHLTQDTACLVANNFNDIAASAKVGRVQVVGGVVAPALRLNAQSNPGKGCIIAYEHCNYEGRAIEWCQNQRNLGAFNGIISAVKVHPGWKVTFYRQANWQGAHQVWNSNDACFVKRNFNDAANSLKIKRRFVPGVIIPGRPRPRPRPSRPVVVVPAGKTAPARPNRGCALIFEHINFQGNWAHVCGSIPNFAATHFDNIISSIKIGPNTRVVLYDLPQYKGDHREFYTDNANFLTIGFNDRASSLRLWRLHPAPKPRPLPNPPVVVIKPVVPVHPKPYRPRPRPRPRPLPVKPVVIRPITIPAPLRPGIGCALIFEHCNYGGRWAKVCGSNPNLSTIQFGNLISAVKVGRYTKITFFAQNNYQGRSLAWENDDSCFVKRGFNDLANSFRIASYLPKPRPCPPRVVIVTPAAKPAPAHPRPGCIIIFEHINYAGKWAHLCGSVPNLAPSGFDNLVSSVKVGRLTRVVFYDLPNYQGRNIQFTANEANFVNKNYNDIASSLRLFTWRPAPRPVPALPAFEIHPANKLPPARPNPGCALLFEHIKYQGRWAHVCGSVANLQGFDNILSSIKLGRFTKTRLFDGLNFTGATKDLFGDNDDFTKIGFNDKASSLRLFTFRPKPRPKPVKPLVITLPTIAAPARPPKGCALVFEHINYQGRWAKACGSNANLGTIHFDNIISSAKVGPKAKIVFFDGINYQGKRLSLTADEPNFVKRNFNDLASSFRVYTWLPKPRPARPQPVINVRPPVIKPPTRPQPGCVIVFTKQNYRGRWAQICGNNANLKNINFNTNFGSIKVGQYAKAQFFTLINFGGQNVEFLGDHANLIAKNQHKFNGSVKIFTFRPQPTPAPPAPLPRPIPARVQEAPFRPQTGCVLLFEHINYQGKWVQLCGNNANLVPLGFNDLVSSIKVASNVKATLFEHINYQGRTIFFTADEPNFVNKNYNDIASSIKLDLFPVVIALPQPVPKPVVIVPTPQIPTPRRPSSGCVTIFEHVNYQGRAVELCYSHPDFTKLNFNDIASSIWVGPKTSVTLFEHVAYGGRSEQFVRDEPNFTTRGWLNDNSSSAKIFSLRVKCDTVKVERAPVALRPATANAPTYAVAGGFINALTGKAITSLAGFSVIAQGQNGVKYTAQIVQNRYLFNALPAGNYEFTIAAAGFIGIKARRSVDANNFNNHSRWSFTLSPALGLNQWRFVLTWGAAPKDLDSTVILATPGQKNQKVNFKHRRSANGAVVLDVDNTKGYGPETITLNNELLAANQTLRYYVHNYSRSPSITVSHARVIVYNYNRQAATFNVPHTGAGLYWHVFDFTKAGGVKAVNKIQAKHN